MFLRGLINYIPALVQKMAWRQPVCVLTQGVSWKYFVVKLSVNLTYICLKSDSLLNCTYPEKLHRYMWAIVNCQRIMVKLSSLTHLMKESFHKMKVAICTRLTGKWLNDKSIKIPSPALNIHSRSRDYQSFTIKYIMCKFLLNLQFDNMYFKHKYIRPIMGTPVGHVHKIWNGIYGIIKCILWNCTDVYSWSSSVKWFRESNWIGDGSLRESCDSGRTSTRHC